MNRPKSYHQATGTADVSEVVNPQGEPESDSPSFEEKRELLRCGEEESI